MFRLISVLVCLFMTTSAMTNMNGCCKRKNFHAIQDLEDITVVTNDTLITPTLGYTTCPNKGPTDACLKPTFIHNVTTINNARTNVFYYEWNPEAMTVTGGSECNCPPECKLVVNDADTGYPFIGCDSYEVSQIKGGNNPKVQTSITYTHL
jgi:hypothetical protein